MQPGEVLLFGSMLGIVGIVYLAVTLWRRTLTFADAAQITLAALVVWSMEPLSALLAATLAVSLVAGFRPASPGE